MKMKLKIIFIILITTLISLKINLVKAAAITISTNSSSTSPLIQGNIVVPPPTPKSQEQLKRIVERINYLNLNKIPINNKELIKIDTYDSAKLASLINVDKNQGGVCGSFRVQILVTAGQTPLANFMDSNSASDQDELFYLVTANKLTALNIRKDSATWARGQFGPAWGYYRSRTFVAPKVYRTSWGWRDWTWEYYLNSWMYRSDNDAGRGGYRVGPDILTAINNQDRNAYNGIGGAYLPKFVYPSSYSSFGSYNNATFLSLVNLDVMKNNPELYLTRMGLYGNNNYYYNKALVYLTPNKLCENKKSTATKIMNTSVSGIKTSLYNSTKLGGAIFSRIQNDVCPPTKKLELNYITQQIFPQLNIKTIYNTGGYCTYYIPHMVTRWYWLHSYQATDYEYCGDAGFYVNNSSAVATPWIAGEGVKPGKALNRGVVNEGVGYYGSQLVNYSGKCTAKVSTINPNINENINNNNIPKPALKR